MEIAIKPSSQLAGSVVPPASKSMSHRVLIGAALSKEETTFENMVLSKDVQTTLDIIKTLGGDYKISGSSVIVKPIVIDDTPKELNCKESASTLRMFMPIVAALGGTFTFTGEESLKFRPLDSIVNCIACDEVSIDYDGSLPTTVKGKLTGGDYFIDGNVTSQFISGLLFALPLLEKDSTLTFTTPVTSQGYIAMTLQTLKACGITINQVSNGFQIPGNQVYNATNQTVENDFSAAAFFACAGALGSQIEIKGMDKNSNQGDKGVLDVLQKMGAKVKWEGNNVTVQKGELQGTTIDGSQIPDIIPILSVVASVSKGVTKIENVGRLRHKECDRLKATAQGLKRLGAKVEEGESFLIIEGVNHLTGGSVSAFGDHRIAMSMAIASILCTENVIIDNKECVKKSYPHFWDDFQNLGGQIDVI